MEPLPYSFRAITLKPFWALPRPKLPAILMPTFWVNTCFPLSSKSENAAGFSHMVSTCSSVANFA